MNRDKLQIGFMYFSNHKFLINKTLKDWISVLRQLGTSLIIFDSTFTNAISEDAITMAQTNGIEPVIHFTSELPLARKFNEVSILLDVYQKWGVKKIIFGDRPNTKQYWVNAGWHYENLVDHFLDRFLPLANYGVQIGIDPVMPPLQPGGDYWDTAFAELFLKGLRQRRMDEILEKLILAAYGFSFNKPLNWGSGGPQRWPLSKPYLTPEGQEDQIGFNNYEWLQAQSERTIGIEKPVIVLNAGHSGTLYSQPDPKETLSAIRMIYSACNGNQNEEEQESMMIDDDVMAINFSLDTLQQICQEEISPMLLQDLFTNTEEEKKSGEGLQASDKIISHYLLLPSHTSGVSDAVLNKVRPVIKKFHPTVGFSLEEAVFARKVSIYPAPLLFGESQINELRASGCVVEILPESGIDIATSIQ
jgi:hypothetical protein